MRAASSLWVFLVVSAIAACTPETKEVPATQLIVRLSADEAVLSELAMLRLRVAAKRGGQWVERNEKLFPASALTWPVDLVLVPPSDAQTQYPIEVILEALDAPGEALAQARVLTSFARRQARVLTLHLAACGSMPLGQLCPASAECLGSDCQTCVEDACGATPVIDPMDLPRLREERLDGSVGVPPGSGAGSERGDRAGVQMDARSEGAIEDAGGGAENDSGYADTRGSAVVTDAGPTIDAAAACRCGKECAALCPLGATCKAAHDCTSGACVDAVCRPACTGSCMLTSACVDAIDCESQSCRENACRAACSGSCKLGAKCAEPKDCESMQCGSNACRPACSPNCDLKAECVAGTDCKSNKCASGTCRPNCAGSCNLNEACAANDDCASSICNGGRCSASCSPRCTLGAPCAVAGDCESSSCTTSICRPSCAGSCNLGAACSQNSDCGSGRCSAGVCRPACAGSCALGAACTQAADCTSGACQSNICRPACAGSCAVAAACSMANDCASRKCISNVCRPACSGSCGGGESCLADNDCASGGTCHPTDKICLTTCSGDAPPITTRSDVTDRRFCREVTGNLNITGDASLMTIAATDFPYLSRIRGDLIFLDRIENATFSALQTIDGSIEAGGNNQHVKSLSFPALLTVGTAGRSNHITANLEIERIDLRRLTRIDGTLYIRQVPVLTRLDASALTTVTGDFNLGFVPEMTTLKLDALTRIGGYLMLDYLPKVPYSAVRPLHDDVTGKNVVGGSISIHQVGCCYSFGQDAYACEDYPYPCP